MQNTYLLSSSFSFSCRRRPMCLQFDDYTYVLNNRYVRCTFCLPSIAACCTCCLNSVYRVPIQPNFYCGLRKSNLIHLSASRNLKLASIDPSCGCVSPLKGERKNRGMLSKGKVKGRRKSSHDTCDADMILSLLTEQVEEEEEEEVSDEYFRSGERISRRVEVEKGGNFDGSSSYMKKRDTVDLGIIKSIESQRNQSNDDRLMNKQQREIEEENRQRRKGGSSSLDEYANNNVDQTTEERYVSESSTEFKRETEENGEEVKRRQRTSIGSQSHVTQSDRRRNKSEKNLTIQEGKKSSQKHLKSEDIFHSGHVHMENDQIEGQFESRREYKHSSEMPEHIKSGVNKASSSSRRFNKINEKNDTKEHVLQRDDLINRKSQEENEVIKTDMVLSADIQVNNINIEEKRLTERTALSESTKISCEGTSKHTSNHRGSLTLLSEMEDKLRTEEIRDSSLRHNFKRNDSSVAQNDSIGSVNQLHNSSMQIFDQILSSQIRKENVVEMVSVHEGRKRDSELRSSSQSSRTKGTDEYTYETADTSNDHVSLSYIIPDAVLLKLGSDSENNNLMKKANKIMKKKPESGQNPLKLPIQTGEGSTSAEPMDKSEVENGVDKSAPISAVSSFSSEMSSLVNEKRILITHASQESNPGLKTNEFEQERFEKWQVAYNIESEQHKIDDMFMKEAILEAKKAADMWEVPVGAVLVQQGAIIARGCNLVEELRDSTAHAEMICIREASNLLRTWRLSETTLYVTLEPCPMCAGAILQARIGTVVWGAPNKLLGADGSWIRLFPSNDEGGNGLVGASDKAMAPVHPFHPKITIRRGVLAGECAEAMQQFFQLRRKKKEQKPKQEDEAEPSTLSSSSCIPVSHRRRSKFLSKIRGALSL